jgi:hypothetical protein
VDEFVAKFAELEGFVPLVAAGIIFVLVNTLSHIAQQQYNERRAHKQTVEKALAPLLNATSDLISRIGEILVFQRPSMLESLRTQKDKMASEILGDGKLDMLRPEQLDRVQSTAYRLLRFLVFVHHFYRITADVPLFSRLRHANYFLQRKISTSLKGGLYSAVLLSKETQEHIAAEILDLEHSRSASDFNVGYFCRLIRDGDLDPDLLRLAVQVFLVDPEPIKEYKEIDHHATNWHKILALAHFGVYLIDFFQDLSQSPRWEEYRIFFVALIRHWNHKAVATRYLYDMGDLDAGSNNYLDTYSDRLAWGHPLYWIERFIPKSRRRVSLKTRYRRFIKGRVLLARGARYVGAHHHKDVGGKGLVIHARKKHEIDWNSTTAQIHMSVCNYLRVEGVVGEVF